MFYKIELALILTDFDEHPTQISDILSLMPTQIWLKGEYVHKTALKRKTNGWVLSSGLDKDAELEDHINALFSKIKPVLASFSNLPPTIEKELSSAIYIYSEENNPNEEHRTPPIHLDREHVETLSRLGVEFDIDLYVLSK